MIKFTELKSRPFLGFYSENPDSDKKIINVHLRRIVDKLEYQPVQGPAFHQVFG